MLPNQSFDVSALVKKIEIAVSRKVGRIAPGDYSSSFKGKGLSFTEVRSYQIDDDVKDIDWNVTARMGEPYVKIFTEERESDIILVADNSLSMDFGVPNRTKKQVLWELSALLALLAVRQHDKVGMILLDDPVRFMPPKKGRKNAMYLLRRLVELPSSRGGLSMESFEHTLKALKKNSVIFFLSDFIWNLSPKRLKWVNQKHESFWFHIEDILESNLSSSMTVESMEIEEGEPFFVHEENDDAKDEWLTFFDRQNHLGRYVKIMTTDSLDKLVLDFFKKRKRHISR